MRTYDEWVRRRDARLKERFDLGDTQLDDLSVAEKKVREVLSYGQLVHYVSFLATMNKRVTLFFRGQRQRADPIPALFRRDWLPLGSDERIEITPKARPRYLNQLKPIGKIVFRVCDESHFGLPRYRGLREIREVQWAVVQHYGIWPTPLIDLSSSLRIAASFAMGCHSGTSKRERSGYLYVVGMPNSTGSITFDIDQHICLVRLQSACPPVAGRPHYQDGFLAGRFPITEVASEDPDEDARIKRKAGILPRLVALFCLRDHGSFWDPENFPIVRERALYPADDELEDRFKKIFGRHGKHSVLRMAQKISRASGS